MQKEKKKLAILVEASFHAWHTSSAAHVSILTSFWAFFGIFGCLYKIWQFLAQLDYPMRNTLGVVHLWDTSKCKTKTTIRFMR